MAEFDILISGVIPEQVHESYDDPQDFVNLIVHEIDRFPDSYGMKVTLLTSDHMHESAIPLAEFSYLKEHSVYDTLALLRAHVPESGPVLEMDHILYDAINMISALNAVKVVEAGTIGEANNLVMEMVKHPDIAANIRTAYPETMRALRDQLVDMDLGPSSRDL
jgi:hypothetical protein